MPAHIFLKKSFLILFLLAMLPVASYVQAALININTAGLEELDTLQGIGPAYAQRIIDYRTQNGPFANIEDIKKVSGIGEVTFSKIKDYITVGEVNASTTETGDNTNNTNQTSTTTAQNTSNQSSSGETSAHYSSTPLTALHQLADVLVGAGRDRLGSVGSPLEFKAETDYSYVRNNIFQWNFGDGSEGVGDILNHTYQYPGEYVVMLNVSLPGGQAAARVNVKIIDPEIVVTIATPERIELQNRSKYEISLFGRALVTRDKIFTFPKDTIIKAGQKISFGANVTGLNSLEQPDISLVIVGTEIKPYEVIAKVEEQRLEKISYVQSQISILQKQLANVSSQQNIAKSTGVAADPIIEGPTVGEFVEPENNESQISSVINAVAPEVSSGIIKNWFQILKRFFFRTEK